MVERVVVVPAAAPGAAGVPCPRCGDAFHEARAGDHLLRGCRTCGGVFLEPRTVARLEQVQDEAILQAVMRLLRILMPHAMDRRGAVSCPFCGVPLSRTDLGETMHSVDTCVTHGTFFDRGEVAAFAEFHQDRRAGELTDEDLANAGLRPRSPWWKRS